MGPGMKSFGLDIAREAGAGLSFCRVDFLSTNPELVLLEADSVRNRCCVSRARASTSCQACCKADSSFPFLPFLKEGKRAIDSAFVEPLPFQGRGFPGINFAINDDEIGFEGIAIVIGAHTFKNPAPLEISAVSPGERKFRHLQKKVVELESPIIFIHLAGSIRRKNEEAIAVRGGKILRLQGRFDLRQGKLFLVPVDEEAGSGNTGFMSERAITLGKFLIAV